MSIRHSAASTEFISIGPVDTGTVDPTGDDVDMAFVAAGTTPVEEDWIEAVWADTSIRLLVAGEDVVDPPTEATVLERGTWVAWVRIHDNPETPARPADVVTVY